MAASSSQRPDILQELATQLDLSQLDASLSNAHLEPPTTWTVCLPTSQAVSAPSFSDDVTALVAQPSRKRSRAHRENDPQSARESSRKRNAAARSKATPTTTTTTTTTMRADPAAKPTTATSAAMGTQPNASTATAANISEHRDAIVVIEEAFTTTYDAVVAPVLYHGLSCGDRIGISELVRRKFQRQLVLSAARREAIDIINANHEPMNADRVVAIMFSALNRMHVSI
jgi:hypothetical protein